MTWFFEFLYALFNDCKYPIRASVSFCLTAVSNHSLCFILSDCSIQSQPLFHFVWLQYPITASVSFCLTAVSNHTLCFILSNCSILTQPLFHSCLTAAFNHSLCFILSDCGIQSEHLFPSVWLRYPIRASVSFCLTAVSNQSICFILSYCSIQSNPLFHGLSWDLIGRTTCRRSTFAESYKSSGHINIFVHYSFLILNNRFFLLLLWTLDILQ